MSGSTDRSEVTSWTMIQGAAAGDGSHRASFARRYEWAVRAYLAARWSKTPHVQSIDDAVQEVFVDCFREGGALARVTGSPQSSFRAFLYGVVRNVALRVEDRAKRNREHPPADDVGSNEPREDEAGLSRVFDRAWARERVREAVQRQTEQAARLGAEAKQRVALLRQRFYEGRPIREIAEQSKADPAVLHHQFARARQEFREALMGVVAIHHPGSPREVEAECALLLGLLGR